MSDATGQGEASSRGPELQGRMSEAVALAESGNLDEASRAFIALAADFPLEARVHFWLADVLTDLGEFDQATTWYEAGLALNPSNCDGWLSLGEVLYAQSHFVQAAQELTKGLTWCPHDHRLIHRLGLVYDVLQRFEDGERHLVRASRLDPENVEYLLDTGRHFSQFSDAREVASRYLTEALRRDLNNVAARVAFVDHLLSNGKPKLALQCLQWLGAPADADVGVAERYAVAFERAERWDEAVDAWRRVVLQRDDPYYFVRLAQAAAQAEDWDLAEAAAASALKIDPELAEAQLVLAIKSFEEGDQQGAVRRCLQALRLDATYVRAAAPSALIELFLECCPEASEWEEALREGPRYY